MRHAKLLAACSAVMLMAGMAQAAAITIPNGSFEGTGTGLIMNTTPSGPAGGGTTVSTATASISGWSYAFTPGPNANYQGWGPSAGVEIGAWTGSTGGPDWWYGNPSNGTQMFWLSPGELYNGGQVVAGDQGVQFKLTTTGISATAATGTLYTAGIDVQNTNKPGLSPLGANMTLEILANGVVVASNTLGGAALPDSTGVMNHISTTWTADAAHAGQSIQLQLIANNFLEGQPTPGDQWGVPPMGLDNATLDATVVPEPATFAVIGLSSLGLLTRRRK